MSTTNEADPGRVDSRADVNSDRHLAAQRTPTESQTLPSVNPTGAIPRDQLVICYSKKDRKRLDEIRVCLTALNRISSISCWDDTLIKPGTRWREEISDAIARAKVALLLISMDFLASDFIMNVELPMLCAAKNDGIVILSLILRPCLFEEFPVLSQFATVNRPDEPLSTLRKPQREQVLVSLAKTVNEAFSDCSQST